MASQQYFDFIGTVWELLPEEDKQRLAETWEGYEQIAASVAQKYMEVDLNISIADLLENTTERWLPFEFTDLNFLSRRAFILSTQEISSGLNLSEKRRLRFRLNGERIYEIDLQGKDPFNTSLLEMIDTINKEVGFPFASGMFENTVLKLTSNVSGLSSSIEILPTLNPLLNASDILLGIYVEDLPKTFPEFRFAYQLPYQNVRSIPVLQDAIRDESVTLSFVEGIDYIIEEGSVINFSEPPERNLWARMTLVNEETPWNNYGYLMDIYQKNSAQYVQVLQGLWYAFWNGPRPLNVKRSLYLLFGLPTATDAGTVTLVTANLVQITLDRGQVSSHTVPPGLEPIVIVGQRVEKFDPLVTGIDVFDKVNYPGFIEAEVGVTGIRRFLTEGATKEEEQFAVRMLEEHTLLPQISVNAFVNQSVNLKNVKTFLDTVKPKASAYLFQIILGAFKDLLAARDKEGHDPNIDITPNLDLNDTTWQRPSTLAIYETGSDGLFNLDLDGASPGDRLEIEVRRAGELIDSFAL